jgi:hypothetical protein
VPALRATNLCSRLLTLRRRTEQLARRSCCISRAQGDWHLEPCGSVSLGRLRGLGSTPAEPGLVAHRIGRAGLAKAALSPAARTIVVLVLPVPRRSAATRRAPYSGRGGHPDSHSEQRLDRGEGTAWWDDQDRKMDETSSSGRRSIHCAVRQAMPPARSRPPCAKRCRGDSSTTRAFAAARLRDVGVVLLRLTRMAAHGRASAVSLVAAP